jgi:hypothetical protein
MDGEDLLVLFGLAGRFFAGSVEDSLIGPTIAGSQGQRQRDHKQQSKGNGSHPGGSDG